jgi:antirestriction protein
MNKTDVEVWYRVYLPTGGDTDIQMRPLDYRSYGDFADDLQEKLDSLGFVDYDIVSWDYLSKNDAWQIFLEEDVWDKWNGLFDVSKEYGVPAETIVEAADQMGYDDFTEFMENAYQGEADNMVDYAVDLLDDVGIDDDLAERYFDYDGFGLALYANGDLNAMIMDDWEDRYDTEAEAQAVYDEFLNKSYTEIAEWFIYDVVGDLKEAVGETMSDYFDYKAFARDLGYDGYDIINGYVFRSY